MTWTLMPQQQQCGAQFDSPSTRSGSRRPGEAPAEATRDRAAQDHEQAAQDLAGTAPQPGESPASPIDNRDQDNTPSAPEPHVEWDEVVQPERREPPRGAADFDDLPLPEGK